MKEGEIINKREKEGLQVFLDNEKEVLKRLEKNYSDALDEINDKIAMLLGRQDADLQHVIYQVQYQQALKTQISAILDVLHNNEFATVSEYLIKSYEDGFITTMYNIHGQGIPLILPIDQKQIAEAIQHETNLSENLYKAMGHDIKDLQKKISGEISRGIAGGQMYSEISRNIASWARIPKNNAMRIARTEGHRIQTKSAMDAGRKAISKGANIVKQWDSSLDKRTRDSHVRVDGEIREMEEKFSNGLLYPGDPNGRAEQVINCRCALLQRARWALDGEETKALGNVEDMSKERQKVIADKLNVPVEELKNYSNQIVPINAKNYEDFKRQYDKIWRYEGSEEHKAAEARIASYSKPVRSNAQKKNDAVVNLQEYTVGEVTYKVDNKHVVLDNTEHEKEIAKIVSETTGEMVQMVPRVVYPQKVSTPDYIIDNRKYDLKEPIGSGKNVLYNMVHKKKSQANNFIFDITNCPLNLDAINEQVKGLYSSKHTSFVDEVIIIKNGKIIDRHKRNK